MWTKNAFWLPPDTPKLKGNKAIAAFAKARFIDPFKIKFTQTLNVKVFGKQAFGHGSFRVELTSKADGSTVRRTGNFVAALEKQKDGSWKFSQGSFNYDRPLA
jgi:ketosteroid isomerase-like protein